MAAGDTGESVRAAWSAATGSGAHIRWRGHWPSRRMIRSWAPRILADCPGRPARICGSTLRWRLPPSTACSWKQSL